MLKIKKILCYLLVMAIVIQNISPPAIAIAETLPDEATVIEKSIF